MLSSPRRPPLTTAPLDAEAGAGAAAGAGAGAAIGAAVGAAVGIGVDVGVAATPVAAEAGVADIVPVEANTALARAVNRVCPL
jgi:hypothetical protein